MQNGHTVVFVTCVNGYDLEQRYLFGGTVNTRLIAPFIALTLLAAGCSASEGSTTPPSTPASTVAAELVAAPDQTGQGLKDARAALEELGYTVTTHDSMESRTIVVEGNWVVTDQAVTGTTVALGAKKPDDKSAEEKAADDAAKAETDAAAQAAADAAAAEAAAVKAAEDALTLGQRNAIGKAEDYLAFSAFSRSGLINQLEFEGFATEEAAFAVDRVAPDWNEQAGLKAQSYLDFSTFSRQGLIDQLVFEGFSAAEAEFGVVAVGY